MKPDLSRAARLIAQRGFLLAFHFDPIIYHPGWKEAYAEAIKNMLNAVPPERGPSHRCVTPAAPRTAFSASLSNHSSSSSATDIGRTRSRSTIPCFPSRRTRQP